MSVSISVQNQSMREGGLNRVMSSVTSGVMKDIYSNQIPVDIAMLD